jgi:hypothetical protein
MIETFAGRLILLVAVAVISLLAVYLFQINRLMSSTPEEVRKYGAKRWTPEELRREYRRLEAHPIREMSYADQIPSKLERRYIVTGGSGE